MIIKKKNRLVPSPLNFPPPHCITMPSLTHWQSFSEPKRESAVTAVFNKDKIKPALLKINILVIFPTLECYKYNGYL